MIINIHPTVSFNWSLLSWRLTDISSRVFTFYIGKLFNIEDVVLPVNYVKRRIYYGLHTIHSRVQRTSKLIVKEYKVPTLSYNITGERAPIFFQSSNWSQKYGGFWRLLTPSPIRLVRNAHRIPADPGSFMIPLRFHASPGFFKNYFSF